MSGGSSRRYPPELRERAVRMVAEIRGQHDSDKTELIKPGKPWRSIEDVELATARWVDWFNHRRLYQYCGDVPPVELEAAYYAQRQRPAAG